MLLTQVCHYHLVAFCPHDLFPNTKSDLGVCEKIHDDALRSDFAKSNRVMQYEAEFLGYLERLIADLERFANCTYFLCMFSSHLGSNVYNVFVVKSLNNMIFLPDSRLFDPHRFVAW